MILKNNYYDNKNAAIDEIYAALPENMHSTSIISLIASVIEESINLGYNGGYSDMADRTSNNIRCIVSQGNMCSITKSEKIL